MITKVADPRSLSAGVVPNDFTRARGANVATVVRQTNLLDEAPESATVTDTWLPSDQSAFGPTPLSGALLAAIPFVGVTGHSEFTNPRFGGSYAKGSARHILGLTGTLANLAGSALLVGSFINSSIPMTASLAALGLSSAIAGVNEGMNTTPRGENNFYLR